MQSQFDVYDGKDGWMESIFRDFGENEYKIRYIYGLHFLATRVYILVVVGFHIVPFRLYEYLKSTKKVLIATDGGAIPLQGSLGFVLLSLRVDYNLKDINVGSWTKIRLDESIIGFC
jgi:hypothetical protein